MAISPITRWLRLNRFRCCEARSSNPWTRSAHTAPSRPVKLPSSWLRLPLRTRSTMQSGYVSTTFLLLPRRYWRPFGPRTRRRVQVMHNFNYLEPTSVEEASRLLTELEDEEVRFIAGGTALILTMRQRMVQPAHLISLGKIDRLRGIQFDPQRGLRIGALERHVDVARSSAVRQHFPMLADMAERVANPQVRNQGTIGGNLCYGDPSTDPPTCLLALNASVVLGSARGERVMPL